MKGNRAITLAGCFVCFLITAPGEYTVSAIWLAAMLILVGTVPEPPK